VLARGSERPALSRLVAVDVEAFSRELWSRAPLLSRAADLPRGFDDLFSAAAVDELVSSRGLRTPFLRIARDGTTLPDRSFTAGGGTGAGIADQVSDQAVLRHFADGATLVLQGLHRTWRPLTDFAQDLAADLGHPVQVNAYVTPRGSTGFSDHYDVHDVFVLQVSGEKRWRIRPPVHPLPLRDEPWTDHRAAVEQAVQQPPLIEETFQPGDCLYLPRGYLHSATALGGTSIHLTIGVHPWTGRHVADALVRAAVDRAAAATALRESLPLGTDLVTDGPADTDVEAVRDALVDALASLSSADVHPRLAAAARSAQRAAPVSPVQQAEAAERLRPDDVVVLRRHGAAVVEVSADGARLLSRAGEVALAPDEVAGVEDLLAAGSTTVSALGADLARRLVVAAVAGVVTG
jgi:ribosomal protein L16 Arg81 hydroxylase